MTIQFEMDTTIKLPAEEVFDRLVNINDYSTWLPKAGIFIRTTQDSDGPVGLGTTYTDKTTVGTFHGEIIEFQRPTKIVFQHRLHWLGLPVMETRPGYKLKSTDSGTELKHTAEGRLFGIFKLMKPRATRIAIEERKRTVDALKQSLEPSSA